MPRLVTIDTETTGPSAEDGDCIVEVASYDHSTSRLAQVLVDPGDRPISFGAMAVHHITPDQVEGEATLEEALEECGLDHESVDQDTYLAAHNAAFDRAFLPPHLRDHPRWICTYRVAMHLLGEQDPPIESFSNQALRYQLGLDVTSSAPDGVLSLPSHRAAFDTWVTSRLVEYLLLETRDRIRFTEEGPSYEECLEEMVRLTQAPVRLRRFRFGKHRDEPIEEVPRSYLRWMLGQDFDDDVLHTCRSELERRGLSH